MPERADNFCAVDDTSAVPLSTQFQDLLGALDSESVNCCAFNFSALSPSEIDKPFEAAMTVGMVDRLHSSQITKFKKELLVVFFRL